MSTPAAHGSSSPRSTVNRTEVQSDLLADRIERWFIQAKPMLPWILVAIVAIIVVSVTISLISGQAAQKEATAWQDVYFSQSAANLETTSEDFQGTTASLWARQLAADAKLNEALLQVYLDHDIAFQKIKEARTEYESVKDSSRDPMLSVRASLGIAKTYDAEGNVEQAVTSYNKVIDSEGADDELREYVAGRIQFIQSEQGKEFFAWFKDNKPAMPRSTGAAEDLKTLPTSPDIKFNTGDTDFLKGSTPTAPPTGGDAYKLPDGGITLPVAPATGEGEKKPESAPLSLPPETPATEQPTTPAEPAAEKPAEPAPAAPASGDAEAKQ